MQVKTYEIKNRHRSLNRFQCQRWPRWLPWRMLWK